MAQEITAGTDKWYCIKLRIFCTAEETLSRAKTEGPHNGRKSCLLFLPCGIHIQSIKDLKGSGVRACLASIKPWSQTPAPPKRKTMEHYTVKSKNQISKSEKKYKRPISTWKSSTSIAMRERQVYPAV
jgi:hypothetical protein